MIQMALTDGDDIDRYRQIFKDSTWEWGDAPEKLMRSLLCEGAAIAMSEYIGTAEIDLSVVTAGGICVWLGPDPDDTRIQPLKANLTELIIEVAKADDVGDDTLLAWKSELETCIAILEAAIKS